VMVRVPGKIVVEKFIRRFATKGKREPEA